MPDWTSLNPSSLIVTYTPHVDALDDVLQVMGSYISFSVRINPLADHRRFSSTVAAIMGTRTAELAFIDSQGGSWTYPDSFQDERCVSVVVVRGGM